MEAVRVFLCGGKGSGKTVLLASLYDELMVPDDRIGLRCQTSAPARARLSDIHSKLVFGWPKGTELLEEHEIPFDFYVDTPRGDTFLGTKTLFYDFSGEAVSGVASNATAADRMTEIGELADSCDVVIAVLDGVDIANSINLYGGRPSPELMNGVKAAIQFWSQSTRSQSGLRQNYYFVVTKWDLFPDTNDSLSAARDLLMNMPEIQRYLKRLDTKSRIRIIPVSAVGYGFAKPIADSRDMEIVGTKLEPVNVAIPVATLIPDLIDAELARQREEMEEEAVRRAHQSIPWWKRLAAFAGNLIERSPTLQRIIYDLGVRPDDIERLAISLKDPLLKSEAQRDKRLAEIAAMIDSEQEAAAMVHHHFEELKLAFDHRYPSSIVRG